MSYCALHTYSICTLNACATVTTLTNLREVKLLAGVGRKTTSRSRIDVISRSYREGAVGGGGLRGRREAGSSGGRARMKSKMIVWASFFGRHFCGKSPSIITLLRE